MEWLFGGSATHKAQTHDDLFLFNYAIRGGTFEAAAIWERKFDNPNVEESLNGQPFRGGLRQALEGCKVPTTAINARNGLNETQEKVFTDVLLFIPPEMWKRKAMKPGGGDLSVVAHNLAEYHNRDFRASLWRGRKARYCIMPAEAGQLSAEDELLIQFGLSIFIPDANDELQHHLTFSGTDPQRSYSALPLKFFENGQYLERPAGFYRQQSHLRLSNQARQSGCILPPELLQEMPELTVTLAFTQQNDDGSRNISRCLAHTEPVNEEAAINEEGNAAANAGVGYDYTYQNNRQLGIRFYPPDFLRRNIVYNAEGDWWEDTYIDLGVGQRQTLPAVFLSHLALPEAGMLPLPFNAWQLAFSQDGRLIDTTCDSQTPFIRFFLHDNKLYYQTKTMRSPDAICPGMHDISVDDKVFSLLPSPEIIPLLPAPARPGHTPTPPVLPNPSAHDYYPSRYKALLALPQQWREKHFFCFSEQENCIVLGRENALCHGELLDRPATLFNQDNNTYATRKSLHNNRFSRQHARICCRDGKAELHQLSEKAPIIVLDEQFRRCDQRPAGDIRPLQLKHGQAIILGCYTFYFRLDCQP